jgi:hypothetical protein
MKKERKERNNKRVNEPQSCHPWRGSLEPKLGDPGINYIKLFAFANSYYIITKISMLKNFMDPRVRPQAASSGMTLRCDTNFEPCNKKD